MHAVACFLFRVLPPASKAGDVAVAELNLSDLKMPIS
jgi:hypothetical protein